MRRQRPPHVALQGAGIVSVQTSGLIGPNPASLPQHEMLADVESGHSRPIDTPPTVALRALRESGHARLTTRCLLSADCVAKLFCQFERVRLIQDQASMRNVDSRIHSPRFDCCVFLFYSFVMLSTRADVEAFFDKLVASLKPSDLDKLISAD
jgi:hypothetical protein